MNNIIKSITISDQATILQALKKMDEINRKLLIIANNNKFISLLSIGDIQRAIIGNIDLYTPAINIVRKDIKVAKHGDDIHKIKQTMRIRRNEFMPIISSSEEIVDVIFWEDTFEEKRRSSISPLNLPVVIMAGGKGTRLKPITNILPKGLIPIGEKTIMEEIISRFVEVGCTNFYFSVNYKADLIKYYFNQIKDKPYTIEYITEDCPLGTAGSLYLLKEKLNSTFFVSNCDIVIEEDYDQILKYHQENKNDLTMVAALKHYTIPYGTIETGKSGQLTSLKEKPEFTFKINSGFYILEPTVFKLIVDGEFLHITDLIDRISKKGGKVGVFPVSECSWKDIGIWDEYLKEYRQ